MTHFDVVVLGAGPGGYVAAIRAAQLGLKAAVVEEKYWGGVCLNVGCIPSKALLRNAELAHLFRVDKKLYGISGDVSFDFGAAFKRSRTVADGRVKGVHFLMKKNGITEFDGRGTFTDSKSMQVALTGGGEETLTFDNCVIATGSQTRLLPGTSLSERVVTYEEQILSDSLPGSIIIAGAGAIGVEFAYVMTNYGVDVTIVEYLDRMVPLEDEEVSAELARRYKKLGVKVLTSTRVDAIDDSADKVRVTVTRDGKQETLQADKVMQAIGFAPRVKGYGLEATGVAVTDRGAIDIDGRMRTNVKGIYAIGDVTAKLMLAHNAEAMGIVAAETIADVETMETTTPWSRGPPTASRRSPASDTPRRRRRSADMRSRWRSSRSLPTARRTATVTPRGSSRSWPMRSSARSSAHTWSGPTWSNCSRSSPWLSSGTSPRVRCPATSMPTPP
jgi:dihydrolipoamide dehydrogenase